MAARTGWCFALVYLVGASASAAAQDDWKNQFFPYSIAASSPTLSHDVALTPEYFHGVDGDGLRTTVAVSEKVSTRLALSLTLPFQIGLESVSSGIRDVSLSAQYLATGSAACENLLAVGATVTIPTGQHGLGSDDLYVGPFAYAGQRLFGRRIVLALNVSPRAPLLHSNSAWQIGENALASLLITPSVRDFAVPVYLQFEVSGTTYLSGSSGLPAHTSQTPAQTISIAPEVFIGPFSTLFGQDSRIALGVFFNVSGDPAHEHVNALSYAVNIPSL